MCKIVYPSRYPYLEGRRLDCSGYATHNILDSQNVVLEWIDEDEDGIMDPLETVTYFTGPRGVEFRRDNSTGDIRWYLYDGLGNVIAEVDELAEITAGRLYDVFGAVNATFGSSDSEHGFVGALGHTSEDDIGLIYMRARYYDPEIGRFISEDPARDGLNWYVYCSSSPVSKLDYSGLYEHKIPFGHHWTYRVDGKDVHILYRGKSVGSFWKSGGNWKHCPNKHIPRQVGRYMGRKFGFGFDSISQTFYANPLVLLAILLDAAGYHSEAAELDRAAGLL